MKVDVPVKEIAVSQSALARALGLSQPRINQLINEGVVIRDETSNNGKILLFESLRNFFMNRTGQSDSGVNFNEEKALLMKAKRELAELKLAKVKEEVVNAADMEKAFTKMFTVLRTQLLALPSTLALQLENKDHHEIYEILSAAMEETLLELSSFDFSALKLESGDE